MLLLITLEGWINLVEKLIFRIDLGINKDKSAVKESTPVTSLQIKVDGVTRSLWRTVSTMGYFLYNVHLFGAPGFTDYCIILCLSFLEFLLEQFPFVLLLLQEQ